MIPHAFPDHYAFVSADITFNDDFPVLDMMTAKDAVKCRRFADRQALVPPGYGTVA